MTITKTQVSSIFKWIGVTALPFFVYFLSPIDDKQFTQPMAMFLALTAWAVAMWCVNLINAAAVGLLLPCLYVVLCGVPEKVALSPWLSDVPFIVIGGFALGRILLDSGLGKRIGLWCVRAMGGSMAGTIIGIWLAVSIVAPFIPAIMGKAALFCAIGISLCDALGFKPKSREATAVILAFCLSVASTKLCYLTGGGDVVLGVGLLKKFSGLDISWVDFAKDNFLPGMIYSAISIGLVMFLLPGGSNHKELKEVVKKDYAALGPVTGEQKRASLLLALTLILLVTDSLHKISAGVTLIAVTFIAFLPGMKLLDSEKFSRINFAPLFFIMGCMSIGSVGGALKVTDWIAGLALPYFAHLSESAAAMTSYVMGVAVNFLLTPLAATTTLTPPLVDVAEKMHFDPRYLFYPFLFGLDNYVFPYEYAVLLYFFSTGYMRFSLMFWVLLARIFAAGLFIYFIALPYWHFVF